MKEVVKTIPVVDLSEDKIYAVWENGKVYQIEKITEKYRRTCTIKTIEEQKNFVVHDSLYDLIKTLIENGCKIFQYNYISEFFKETNNIINGNGPFGIGRPIRLPANDDYVLLDNIDYEKIYGIKYFDCGKNNTYNLVSNGKSYFFSNIHKTGYRCFSSYSSAKKMIEFVLEEGYKVFEFDNFKEFSDWALKE